MSELSLIIQTGLEGYLELAEFAMRDAIARKDWRQVAELETKIDIAWAKQQELEEELSWNKSE